MFEKIILHEKGLDVKLTDHVNDDIIDILEHAVQGAEGGLRFSQTNIRSRIEEYGDRVRFMSLYKKNRIAGTAGAYYHITGQGALEYPSTYIKYLAFLSVYQTNINKKRKKVVIRRDDNLSFKKKTIELFGTPHVMDLPGVKEGDKHVLYAFIENMNERSKNIVSQVGFEYIRSFLTVAFSRFTPKKDNRVSKLQTDEKDKMNSLVKDFYKNYSFFNEDHLFKDDKYYVLKEDGEIVAGVWASPTVYKVYNIPGVWGWILRNILPIIPLFRRILPVDQLKCLLFDGLWFKKGHESKIETLMESVLATEGYYTGLIWADDHGELYDVLRTKNSMGALNRMLNAKPGLVYAKFVSFDNKEKERFYDVPAFISSFVFS
ncbi:MAG: hypothetical protein J6T30_08240 [Bacteroidales bacterium]|nr:hypothetical protein [Bacteroidales bacterium]